MIYNATDETLTILKFFKKYKHCWFNSTAIAHELEIPQSRVKGILTILSGRGLIEPDIEDNCFYRLKEDEQKMITAEEVRKYQKEQKSKINVTSYIIAIEEAIKENMLDLSRTGMIYAFDKIVFAESLEKILKILKDNGYDAKPIPPSHYYEFGGLSIKWGE